MKDTKVIILGKTECGKCQACKEKMERMQIPYNYIAMDRLNGWRRHRAAEALAACVMAGIDFQREIPVVVVDGRAYRYAKGMKVLKKERKNG
jgi:glutaredoxin